MVLDKLPLSHHPEVRQRIEEVFSREVLGAVLVGKFVGDYAALKTVFYLGNDIGYTLGIVVSIALFIYWDKLARKAQETKDELSQTQTKMDDYGE